MHLKYCKRSSVGSSDLDATIGMCAIAAIAQFPHKLVTMDEYFNNSW